MRTARLELGRLGISFWLLVALTACHKEKPPPPAKPAVGAITLKGQAVPITTTLPGRITAFRVAEVRPQVSGVIQKRLFVEGQQVQPDQQLYQIDPAPYVASVASAQATVAHAKAELASAQATYDRYVPLVQAQAVSRQDLDTATASLRQAEADVASGQASLKSAAINLAYTRLASPIGGHSGRSSVTEGALVTANQADSLVTVTQLDPIYVDVTQPSATLNRFRRELASGQMVRAGADAVRVTLVLEDGSHYDQPGTLQFSEVTVDQGTGSVTLRAVFANDRGLLLPGMFVQEIVEEGLRQNGLLVPQRGVTHDAKGQALAFVVGPDGKVAQRQIKTEQAVGNDWLVSDGLAAGDRVILDGMQKVKPGMEVDVTEAKEDIGDERPKGGASAPDSKP
jgi:membrane fusion protein (multidrug efflux system)